MVVHAGGNLNGWVLPLAAAVLLAAGARHGGRLRAGLAAAALAVALAGRAALGPEEDAQHQARARRVVETVAARARAVSVSLAAAARRAAALPEAASSLAGDGADTSRLFEALEVLRNEVPDRPALAVHGPAALSPLAWAGRALDLQASLGLSMVDERLFVLAGSVSTTLVATAPVRAPDGRALGFAAAELPVAARRNIRNEYLKDFDLLTRGDPAVEVVYVDVRDGDPPGPEGGESVLRGPDGRIFGIVRVAGPVPAPSRQERAAPFRASIAVLASVVGVAWMTGGGWHLAAGATALRLILAWLGPPFPAPSSTVLSPHVYASSPRALEGTPLARLLESPADLLLTTAWLAALAVAVVQSRLSRPPAPRAWWRAAAAPVAALVLIAAVFAWIADTVSNSSLDLDVVALVPRSPPHLLLQAALLILLAAAGALLVVVFDFAGSLPGAGPGRVGRVATVLAAGVAACVFWPRGLIGLPLFPAAALFTVPAALALTRQSWSAWLARLTAGPRAILALLAVAVLVGLLYPTLAHFGEKSTRAQIERDYAPLVLRQPQWRDYVLGEARGAIDGLDVLEESPPGPYPPDLEELAFSVWSGTDLATFGFSSAVEIQDASGAVISRFALNLPSLSGPDRPLPRSQDWQVSRERVTLASAERRVLHARKLLVYHGEVHGAVHLYVGDDFRNLPFIVGRDPYSVLYRTSPRGSTRDRALALLVYDRERGLVFSSAERPPALPPALLGRVRARPEGLWTTLPVGGRPHHTFLFAAGSQVYGLAYAHAGAGRYAAELVEAVSGLTLAAAAALAVLVLVRTAIGRGTLSIPSMVRAVRERFALRLFVAFTALAFIPVAVLQVVVREFVADRLRGETEDQALELGAVAKKAVDDFVFFQKGESGPAQPVTDAALVWVSSLIRNDLDVFERGRLVASSKRELYASGLLAPRVSGAVYRSLVLEGEPAVIRTEQIGGFSYLVVSLPVQLDGPEPGVLSIPLALRQREAEAALQELDRTIRLASLVFLVVAAVLAHSISRRISGPIRDLTGATRKVARGDLEARVVASSRDELSQLVESFNQMAGDLERQRRDLERSNRLAAWAEMARQVAHEVKNPLTPIQLSAEHLRRVFRDRDQDFAATLETCTQTILKQVRILRGIVTEFSAFARPPAPVLEPQDISTLVPEVLRPYQAALPPGVELTLAAEDTPPVLADRRLLERAVVNLVENALQAVGDQGQIRVAVLAAEGGVEVQVEDSGPGIEPELRERLFDPFFSTKTGGSGLGLALVKRIAEDHGGRVAIRSAPGEKTRAVLWFPVAREPAATRTAAAAR